MLKKIFFFLILIIGLAVAYTKLPPLKSSGQPAPQFEETLANGDAFKLSDLKGKYVLIDFWGSWCPPCRKSNPKLVQLYDTYADKGFEIVSIAIEKNEKTWARAIQKDGLRWPYHILRKSRLVATDALALQYTVTDLPSFFLLDPDQNIVGTNMTYQEIDQYLRDQLL